MNNMNDINDIQTFLNSKRVDELADNYRPEQLDRFYDDDIFNNLSVANQRKLQDLSLIFTEEEYMDAFEDGRGLMKKKSKKQSKKRKRRNKGKKKGKKSAKKGKKSARKTRKK